MPFNDGTETILRLSPPEIDPYLIDRVDGLGGREPRSGGEDQRLNEDTSTLKY